MNWCDDVVAAAVSAKVVKNIRSLIIDDLLFDVIAKRRGKPTSNEKFLNLFNMRESHIYYIGLSYKIFFNVQRDELASPSPSLNSPIKAEQQQQQQI